MESEEEEDESRGILGESRKLLLRSKDEEYDLLHVPSKPPEVVGGSPDNSFYGTLGMTLCVLLFFYEGIVYNMIFLAEILPAIGQDQLVLPYMAVFNILLILSLWSYWQAHRVDPGLVPDRWLAFTRQSGSLLPTVVARLEWQPGFATMCKKCCISRPERAHHCQVCNTCVLRMDHHCPWIKNCVGFYNYKFFLLLSVYIGITVSMFFITSLPALVHIFSAVLSGESELMWDLAVEKSSVLTFLISDCLALLIALMVGAVAYVHVPLACQNMTSVEGNFKNMSNPYAQGTTMANLEQVFGVFGLDWFLPIYPARPVSDGIAFTRSPDADDQPVAPERLPCRIGGEENEVEKLWSMQYHVQAQRALSSDQPSTAIGPITMLQRWFNGVWDPTVSCKVQPRANAVPFP